MRGSRAMSSKSLRMPRRLGSSVSGSAGVPKFLAHNAVGGSHQVTPDLKREEAAAWNHFRS
jgi:hypothetical protein